MQSNKVQSSTTNFSILQSFSYTLSHFHLLLSVVKQKHLTGSFIQYHYQKLCWHNVCRPIVLWGICQFELLCILLHALETRNTKCYKHVEHLHVQCNLWSRLLTFMAFYVPLAVLACIQLIVNQYDFYSTNLKNARRKHPDCLADSCKRSSVNRTAAGLRLQVQVMDFSFFHLLFKHALCS